MLRLVAFMLVPVIIYIKCGIYLLHLTKLAILRLCCDATALDFHGAKRGTFMIQSGIRGNAECNSDDWPLLDGWNRCSAIGRRDCRCRRHDAGQRKTGICSPDRNAVWAMPSKPGGRWQAQILRREIQGKRQQGPEVASSTVAALKMRPRQLAVCQNTMNIGATADDRIGSSVE